MKVIQTGQIEKGEGGQIIVSGLHRHPLEADAQRGVLAQFLQQAAGPAGFDVPCAVVFDLREDKLIGRMLLVQRAVEFRLGLGPANARIADGISRQC